MSGGIERVTIVFDGGDDEGDDVEARITVQANGVSAIFIDGSNTNFFDFWGDYLSKIIAKLQDDCLSGAATGGDKEENDG